MWQCSSTRRGYAATPYIIFACSRSPWGKITFVSFAWGKFQQLQQLHSDLRQKYLVPAIPILPTLTLFPSHSAPILCSGWPPLLHQYMQECSGLLPSDWFLAMLLNTYFMTLLWQPALAECMFSRPWIGLVQKLLCWYFPESPPQHALTHTYTNGDTHAFREFNFIHKIQVFSYLCNIFFYTTYPPMDWGKSLFLSHDAKTNNHPIKSDL